MMEFIKKDTGDETNNFTLQFDTSCSFCHYDNVSCKSFSDSRAIYFFRFFMPYFGLYT